jgi:small subunit ribosomal protein S1
VIGQLRASEISRDRVEDARTVLKVGDEVEARFTGVDRKNRVLSLSIKAKEAEEEQQAMASYRAESNQTSSSATLGDLLKEQMKSE